MSNTPAVTVSTVAAEIAAEVTAILERVFASVEMLRAETQQVFAYHRDGAPSGADFGLLRPAATAQVGGGDSLIVGAGYVAAVGALADQAYFLEWWSTPGDGPPSRLEVDLDPHGALFHDYTRLPWFVVPRDTAARHVTGPYVDYLCTDEYALTFTSPVFHQGQFVGVAGADVFVSRFESRILPRLRRLASTATLVNAEGRVLVSNSARLVTGSLVRRPDVGVMWAAGSTPASTPASNDGTTLYRCGDFPIGLLVDESLQRRSA